MAEKKNVVKKVLAALLTVCVLALVFFAGYFTNYLTRSEEEKLMEWALGLIGDNYMVYDEETGELIEYTAEDYLKAIANELLDPYSAFYTKEEYADLVSTSQGNQYGIGVTFLIVSDKPEIYSVVGNSPAERAGVTADGLVTAVEYNGEKTAFDTYDGFAAALQNVPAYADFTLWVDYGEGEKPFVMKKESFKESYVFYADSGTGYMFLSDDGKAPVGTPREDKKIDYLPEDTAYIRYDSFMYTSPAQFREAYEYMFTRGRENLILDLRGNGGGYMDVLQEIASFFLEGNNRLIAVAHSKKDTQEFSTRVSRKDSRLGRVVVLADDGTASASECLIGAMMHYGVIGYDTFVAVKNAETGKAATYGKGIMQTTYPNAKFGGAIKLPTAYIYWPDDQTCIHGKGIEARGENAVLSETGADRQLERAAAILG